MKPYYYGILVLVWLAGYSYSIFYAKSKKFNLRDKCYFSSFKKRSVSLTICGIVGAGFFLLALFAYPVFPDNSQLLLLLSIFSITGILNGLSILFQWTVPHKYYPRKDHGIGIILSSLGFGTTVLYKLVDLLLIHYLSILIIAIGITFLARSLKMQIRYRIES